MGRALVEALEVGATELVASEMVLDTADRLDAAVRLYLAMGYGLTAPHNDNPYATSWFRKPLGFGDASPGPGVPGDERRRSGLSTSTETA